MGENISSRTRSKANFGANVSEQHEAAGEIEAGAVLATETSSAASVAATTQSATNENEAGASEGAERTEPVAGTSRGEDAAGVSVVSEGAPIILENRRRSKRKRAYTNYSSGVKISRSIFNDNYVDYFIENPNGIAEFGQFLMYCVPHIFDILRKELQKHRHLKCCLVFPILFINSLDIQAEYAYRTRFDILVGDSDLEEFISDLLARLLSIIDEHQLAGGSGFTVSEIRGLEVHCNKLVMLRGKSHIPLPNWLQFKRAVVNPQNVDSLCFKHAVLTRHYTGSEQCVVRPRRVAEYERLYNFDGISFPTPLRQVKKFARQNSMSINVYSFDKKYVYPVIINKVRKPNHIDLLYFSKGKKSHYAFIKNMSRLVRSQITRHSERVYFCVRCLSHFLKADVLAAHEAVCDGERLAALILPPKEKAVFKFSKHDACHLMPLFMVCDFECFLKKIDTCGPDPNKSFTQELQSHQPAGFGAYLISNIDTTHVPRLPLGYFHCVSATEKQLCRQIYKYFVRVAKGARLVLDADFPIHASQQAQIDHANATQCFVCGLPFTERDPKVFDHSHYVEKFNTLGSAHLSCNSKMAKHKYIVCYLHNLVGYDGHILINMLCARKLKIKVLAISQEKYLTFTTTIKNCVFRFQDSYLMLGASLKTVSETLSDDQLIELKKNFSPELCALLHKKAPFPYSFFSGAASMEEKGLPEAWHFKNDLTEESISPAEYERAKKIYEAGNCVTFKDFACLYMCSDIILLADCCVAARKFYWDLFKVDMCSFLTLPHLSLQCMLKTTKVKLELLDDTMYLEYELVKRSLYGGLTFSNIKYVECGQNTELFYMDAIGNYFFNYVLMI